MTPAATKYTTLLSSQRRNNIEDAITEQIIPGDGDCREIDLILATYERKYLASSCHAEHRQYTGAARRGIRVVRKRLLSIWDGCRTLLEQAPVVGMGCHDVRRLVRERNEREAAKIGGTRPLRADRWAARERLQPGLPYEAAEAAREEKAA